MELIHSWRPAQISRKTENTGFRCSSCGVAVSPLRNGGYRNHCPHCLWSRHVDERPGDRAASCGALMEPIGLDRRSSKGFLVVHRCVVCGFVRPNRIAEDPVQPDSIDSVLELLRRRP